MCRFSNILDRKETDSIISFMQELFLDQAGRIIPDSAYRSGSMLQATTPLYDQFWREICGRVGEFTESNIDPKDVHFPVVRVARESAAQHLTANGLTTLPLIVICSNDMVQGKLGATLSPREEVDGWQQVSKTDSRALLKMVGLNLSITGLNGRSDIHPIALPLLRKDADKTPFIDLLEVRDSRDFRAHGPGVTVFLGSFSYDPTQIGVMLCLLEERKLPGGVIYMPLTHIGFARLPRNWEALKDENDRLKDRSSIPEPPKYHPSEAEQGIITAVARGYSQAFYRAICNLVAEGDEQPALTGLGLHAAYLENNGTRIKSELLFDSSRIVLTMHGVNVEKIAELAAYGNLGITKLDRWFGLDNLKRPCKDNLVLTVNIGSDGRIEPVVSFTRWDIVKRGNIDSWPYFNYLFRPSERKSKTISADDFNEDLIGQLGSPVGLAYLFSHLKFYSPEEQERPESVDSSYQTYHRPKSHPQHKRHHHRRW